MSPYLTLVDYHQITSFKSRSRVFCYGKNGQDYWIFKIIIWAHILGRVSTTRGNPTVGGPLVGFLFENPHFPRGYRVGSTSNSPTRYFAEWVNKSTFFVERLYDSVWKRCFLVDTIRNWLRWCAFSETSWKDHDYNKKVYILCEKQVNSHSATETPTRRVVP